MKIKPMAHENYADTATFIQQALNERRFADYQGDIATAINLPGDIAAFEERGVDVPYPILVVNAALASQVQDKYGLPNVLGSILAAASNDADGTPYIVLTTTLLNSNDTVLNAVLTHELVHCDQMLRGDLRMVQNTGEVIWKGQVWSREETMQTPEKIAAARALGMAEEEAYFYLELEKPWEIEAYRAIFSVNSLDEFKRRQLYSDALLARLREVL